MTPDLVAALEQILVNERAALLSADYGALDKLAADKETHLSLMAQNPPDDAILAVIKAKMNENQDLIATALRGVRAAQERLDALEAVRDGLTTYDPAGRVASITTPQSRFEKKA